GLRVPAMAAPMTGISTPALVAEACAAGILGGFPTSNARSSSELEEWFDEIDERIEGHRASTSTDGASRTDGGSHRGSDDASASNTDGATRPLGAVVANLIVGRQNTRLDADVECVARRGI